MKVAIIGGGASGLVCAIECAKAGAKVTLFEQNKTCGKKILVSGNGKCNITNKHLDRSDYEAKNSAIIDTVLKRFGFEEQKRYFASLGLLLAIKEDGKAYPYSFEAKTVLDLLLSAAKQYGVHIKTETKIERITNNFTLVFDNQKEHFDAVVIATGSLAANHLGGNESGYGFAKTFGHSIMQPYPSLVQLTSVSKYPKMMSGVKLEAEVSLMINGLKEQTVKGDLLFTDYGLSGLAILDVSQKASFALTQHYAVDVVANLLPSWEPNALSKHLLNVAKNNPGYTIETILHTLFPAKVVKTLLSFLEIDRSLTQPGMKLAKKIVFALQNWSFEIDGTKGFRYAEVCGGGVSSDEIDTKTFESKKQKGLYFIGEVLDVVGKRGGYNFAFAWGSGYLCANGIIKQTT